ncbi:MAG: UDP-glucose/GDP-mannose dehydrogenase family protein [Myxococcales bacterium]|nr:UDP-glucose/GDP-mannose dehydrogenase family protein [Myxococcales bacterium]
MRISVIGTGYVGLVAGACFAKGGHAVTCVDIDVEKVRALRHGVIPIYEPDLDAVVKEGVAAGRLDFTTDTAAAVREAAAVFVAVGTPPGEDGSADLRHVLGVARTIARHLRPDAIVVMKSTVPIGTCDKVAALIKDLAGTGCEVVSNPEFLREGVAVRDFLQPDRVVVGTRSERARGVMRDLYAPFLRHPTQLLTMDVRSAEMTKYAANAMLATRISFINEIATLCEAVGADVGEVARGIGSDARIGPHFLQAGIGYGGSCFPKDVKALMATGRAHGHGMEVMAAVEAVNAQQKAVLARKVLQRFGSDLTGRTVALLGLAFKPDTDDMREAPAIVVANLLSQAGATVVGHDPAALATARKELGDAIQYAPTWQQAVAAADVILIVTEWKLYCELDPRAVAHATACRLVFDGRNALDVEGWRAAGFEVEGMGRA